MVLVLRKLPALGFTCCLQHMMAGHYIGDCWTSTHVLTVDQVCMIMGATLYHGLRGDSWHSLGVDGETKILLDC